MPHTYRGGNKEDGEPHQEDDSVESGRGAPAHRVPLRRAIKLARMHPEHPERTGNVSRQQERLFHPQTVLPRGL